MTCGLQSLSAFIDKCVKTVPDAAWYLRVPGTAEYCRGCRHLNSRGHEPNAHAPIELFASTAYAHQCYKGFWMSTEHSRPALSKVVGILPATVPALAPEAIERRMGKQFAVRLGANESLFGPAPQVLSAIREAAAETSLYCDPEGWKLREALALQLKVTPNHLVLGCGIDELLGMVVRCYLDPGQTVVMSAGVYPTMKYYAVGHGARVVTSPYSDYRNDVEQLIAVAQGESAKLLYLANPDNPTGTWLQAEQIENLVTSLPGGCLLLLDEAYADFLPPSSLPNISRDEPAVIRFRTFSKGHGLAGLRVGYAFSAPETIRPIDRIRNQFGVGRLAQEAALASLNEPRHLVSVVSAVEEGRADYYRIAESHGIHGLRSATNFVAFDVGDGERARTIVRRLAEEHSIFIRSASEPPLDRCLRVTVGRPPERRAFESALSVLLSTC